MIQGPIRFGLTMVLVLASSLAWAQSEPVRQPVSQVAEGERLIRLGEEAYRLRRWDEAERDFRSAIALREKALGPWHPTLAADLNKFATFVAAVWGTRVPPDATIRGLLFRMNELFAGLGHAARVERVERKGESFVSLKGA